MTKLLPSLLLAASWASAQPAAQAVAAAPAAPAVQMPRLDFKVRTLANGLQLVSARDTSSATVAIHVWYHVGGKDDPEGRSGFAHLFEHIMFKSTKHMKAETLDRLTEDVGGLNNAFTANDVTVYFEIVPSNHLETLLWAEADRLAALNVEEATFKSERDVVKEEFRQSVLAPPYGRFNYLLEQRSFTKHPYKHSVIGSIEDLDAASIEDVRAFHRTYYRPDNATLVVVGDFEQADLDRWVDTYFGAIEKPAAPLPRVTVKEPERAKESRFTERAENVPLPAVGITYLVPNASSPDAEPLQIAAAVLSEGNSSRLYRTLVYEKRMAASAEADADLREDAGLFRLTAVLASEKKPEDVEAALLAEIEKMKTAPVTSAELDRAKIQLVAETVRTRETNNGKARSLGEAAVLLKDPDRVNTDLARLQRVTADDVSRVVKRYLTAKNRLVIHYLPIPGTAPNVAPAGGGK